MFDHVEFTVGDIKASRGFYAATLAAVGIEEFFFDTSGGSAGFGSGDVTGLLIYNGEPGYRPHYTPGYYAAFLFDPNGNNIEFLFRDSEMT